MKKIIKHISAKRCCASFTAGVMFLGLMTTAVYAENENGNSTQLMATEVDSINRLDELGIKPNELLTENLYNDNDIVTVIVEMEKAPIMDYYEKKTNYSLSENNSSGESVAKFLASSTVQKSKKELENTQQNIISKIEKLVDTDNKITKKSTEIEVVGSWSTIVNAIAINIPYKFIDKIAELDGVKRSYIEKVYEQPEPIKNSVVEDGKEVYEYSYDMVGVEETWNNGYTGKETLVAVLDSGLDVTMNWSHEVVRAHEAFTDESFKSGNPTDGVDDWELRYTEESVEEFVNNNKLHANTASNGQQVIFKDNIAYKNLKVPYAWDYADKDLNVFNESSDHGTHVAGTVAGFAKTEEGEIKFSGVSPDAQVLFMKVFSSFGGGATEAVLISALEDSLKLGADVINLSLGSINGFSEDDTIQNDVYERINNAGIVLATSAGNDDKSSEGNKYNGNNTTSNPDESMVSSPSVYSSNLSVASIENNINVQSCFMWSDGLGSKQKAYFDDPWYGTMKSEFSDKEYPIYEIDGVGSYEDYYNSVFNNGKTGFALVKRGEISFTDKINNAMTFTGTNSQGERYGVLGVIIYDNNPEGTELIKMSIEGTAIYSAFISGVDGAKITNSLQNGNEVKLQVLEKDDIIDSETSGQMSSFTSWGTTPGLELKPEITAPGGNIWSTLIDRNNTQNEGYTGKYGMMSGTSMAAPHISGISTLIHQRILQENSFDGATPEEIADLTSQFLVSTAIPKKDENGVYYSPRQQGAGLVNIAAATKTPAYISVDGKNIGKLELGDDREKIGQYDIKFNLNNISNNNLEYDAQVVLMRPNTNSISSNWGDRNTIADSETIIKTISLGKINVNANESVTINETISLTENEKAELDRLFENGIFIEGYVVLNDATGNNNPELGLPLLAFYGDWTKAPIFDCSLWFDEPIDNESVINNENNWGTGVIGSTQVSDMYGVIGSFNLGQNVFDPQSMNSQLIYHKENITISPNGDEYLDRIDNYILYQLRDAKVIVIEAKDSKTGELYMREMIPYVSRTIYDPESGAAIPYSIYGDFPSWDGTDLDNNVLPSGTKCTYSITAYGDGDYSDKLYDEEYDKEFTDFDAIIPGENEPTYNGHKMDTTGDIVSFPVTIDTVAPKLENNTVTFYKENDRVYIKGKIYDEDGSLASVEIVPIIVRKYKEGYGDANYAESGLDRLNPFYVENIYDPETKELSFTVDVTEYNHTNESYEGENNYYDYIWTGNVMISCGDYGANDRTYAVKVDTTEGIVLSQTSALLTVGSNFELSVNNNTLENHTTLTRVSSNPDVATIDEYGKVVAISPGQTIITVSNGTSSAICVVAVEDKAGKVKDFNLSIDEFSKLKPDGQLLVKVDNIQPANSKIDNILWEVVGDENYSDEYVSSLVGVASYSEDALEVCLYLKTNMSPELTPSGSGKLKVTIDGIERVMDFSWEGYQEDTLVSDEYYGNQIVYVNQGDSAVLHAKYRESTLHQVSEVKTELVGAKLDAPDFFYNGAKYEGKIVNDENYTLPESIKFYILYSDGSRVEIVNYPYYPSYEYDSLTGEFKLYNAPYGTDTQLVIEGTGVVSEGTPAGTISDEVYTRPDNIFGPFDWTVTNGTGNLEIGEVDSNGTLIETAIYTPSEPGVSYLTATTKDGQYSVNFAVVSEGVLADKLTIDSNKGSIKVGETIKPVVTLSPTPTNVEDQELIWQSFNEEVATVSEDGTITAIAEGYAYIKISSAVDSNITNYYILNVTKDKDEEEEENDDVTGETYIFKGHLKIIIEEANKLLENMDSDNLELFKEALNNAKEVFENKEAKLEDIENAFKGLDAVIQELSSFKVDKTDLLSLYDSIKKLNSEEYLKTSWNSLEVSLADANNIILNESSSEVNIEKAYNDLLKSLLKLRLKPNKDELEALINSVENLVKNNYTVESWNNFISTLEIAKNVYSDEESTISTISKAIENLKIAIDRLVKADDSSNENTGEDTDDKDQDQNQDQDKDDDSHNNDTDKDKDDLPQTGGVPSGVIAIIGLLSLTSGVSLFKRKK